MPVASLIELYDRLANAPDERTRARVIAEAFEMLESRYPHLPDLATRQNLSETELKLTKEIEQVRAELKLEIEKVRKELKETELKLTREIAQLRADTVRDIERGRVSVIKWSFVFWLTQFAAILALLWRVWPQASA